MPPKTRKAKEMRTAKQKLAIVKKIEAAPRGKKNLVMQKFGVYPAQVAGWKKLRPWERVSPKLKVTRKSTLSSMTDVHDRKGTIDRIARQIGKKIAHGIKNSAKAVEILIAMQVREALAPKKKSRG
jgi:hypothetical protein